MGGLRAAVIGCGKAGSEYSDDMLRPGVYSHAHAYSAHPETNLVAVCDTDSRKAAVCAEHWDAQSYTSLSELLERASPEVVSVCTPDATHVDVTLEVLAAKGVRAVLCEKPLALNVTDSRRVAEEAANRGVALAVNYSRRYDQAYRELRTEIGEGRIGKVQALGGVYGKGVLHNGSHWFDLVRFLFGDVAWVEAAPTSYGFGADPTLDVWLGMKAGFTGFLHGTDHDAYTVFEVDVFGRDQRVQMTDNGRDIHYFKAGASEVVQGYRMLEQAPYRVLTALDRAMLGAVENIVNHLNANEPLLCTGLDGVEAVRIVEGARASVATGERVWL